MFHYGLIIRLKEDYFLFLIFVKRLASPAFSGPVHQGFPDPSPARRHNVPERRGLLNGAGLKKG